MSEQVSGGAPLEAGFEVHGVRAVLSASDPSLFKAALGVLPPDATRCAPGPAEDHFELLREGLTGYRVVSPSEGHQACPDLELALSVLEAELYFHVAEHAPDRISIHAGVAVHRDRAIVVPGPPFSGKTTLIAALVRAGALYFSDEYAFLDEAGLVHPFPRPLSVREPGRENTQWPVGRLGGAKGRQPVPIGVLAVTSYRPDREFKPQRRSRARGMLALLANTLPGGDDDVPAQALAVTRRAVENAVVLEGERGEAEPAADALLQAVTEAGPPV